MATIPTTSQPPSIYYTKALSTATLGLILGSTTWASAAVMPSIIDAPLSTHSKLSVFDGLINRANAILPPVFITAASGLAYLSYYYYTLPTSASLVTARESGMRYGIATAAVVACVGLQVVIVPKNDQMQEIVRSGKGKDDDGKEGNERVGELLRWNWARVGLSALAFGIGIVELAM
jgi:Domain of unknown function (DUF1772)